MPNLAREGMKVLLDTLRLSILLRCNAQFGTGRNERIVSVWALASAMSAQVAMPSLAWDGMKEPVEITVLYRLLLSTMPNLA
jgi:hypothetical protein